MTAGILIFCMIALTVPPTAGQAAWTVMVYIDGDNNLENAAIDDLNELEDAGSTANVNIVVQMDRIDGHDASNGDWTSTRRYYVTADPNGYDSTIVSTMVQDMGELNMGNPNTLVNFVSWAQTNYPATNYLLVLWDHGAGWKSYTANIFKKGMLTQVEKTEPVKGICFDDTDNDYLDTPDLQTAFNTMTSGGANPIDITGLDACLMAMLEIGYEIHPYSSYMVGSEENVPFDGWDYQNTFNWLISNPGSTPPQVASQIVTDYMNFYGLAGNETHSAVVLSQMGTLASAVDTLATDLGNNINTYFYDILDARDQVEEYGDPDYIDLYHFAQLLQGLIPDAQIQTDTQNVMNAITASIINEGHGASNPDSYGLSIYFPYGRDDYLSRYETETQFAQNTNWDEFLTTYYTTVPPPLHAVAVIDDDNGRQLTELESYYTDTLDALSVPYDYYNADVFGTPDISYLQAHAVVIWFTGSDFSTTLTVQDENVLMQYLNGGGKLFLSSQDYVWDLKNDGRYPSTFLRNYLHTMDEGEDTGVNFLTGVPGNPVGNGLSGLAMCFPSCSFIDYADWIQKDGISEYAFYNEDTEYVALTYTGGYDVVFFAFMFEGIESATDQQTVMQRILDFFGPIPTMGSLQTVFDTNTFLVAGDTAYATDVLGSAKIAFALGQAGASENPEGRTDITLTTAEHDTGNLIPVGGPAVNPVASEFGTYFNVTYTYQPGVSFEIFADLQSIYLDLTMYPSQDIAVIYLAEHNGRFVMLVWGYGWQGTYAASVFLGDVSNWSAFNGYHMIMLRWNDSNSDGLVQSGEITVEAQT